MEIYNTTPYDLSRLHSILQKNPAIRGYVRILRVRMALNPLNIRVLAQVLSYLGSLECSAIHTLHLDQGHATMWSNLDKQLRDAIIAICKAPNFQHLSLDHISIPSNFFDNIARLTILELRYPTFDSLPQKRIPNKQHRLLSLGLQNFGGSLEHISPQMGLDLTHLRSLVLVDYIFLHGLPHLLELHSLTALYVGFAPNVYQSRNEVLTPLNLSALRRLSKLTIALNDRYLGVSTSLRWVEGTLSSLFPSPPPALHSITIGLETSLAQYKDEMWETHFTPVSRILSRMSIQGPVNDISLRMWFVEYKPDKLRADHLAFFKHIKQSALKGLQWDGPKDVLSFEVSYFLYEFSRSPLPA
ncbi:hypothetical protein BDN72DRAFT_847286 [Pluteus cervinus]|uniref:Uncharacterized protein n=1 Tax=Pluteus cervinus TaxID=181527 RepID=A0ACD3ADX7_9AGAR|nr:hypothetical protein BDN72DRAFT_847286 [Pluteus cervinus]